MTREKTVDTSPEAVAAGSITPGVPAGATVIADPPPILSGGGPRDALVTPLPGDIIPELDTKGYHTGRVAQPAQPVSVDGVTVAGFVSSEPSRFPDFAELKRAPHRDEADLGVPAGPDPAPAVRMLPGVGMVDTSQIYGGGPRQEAGPEVDAQQQIASASKAGQTAGKG
jgi:hypothetical protein